MTEIPLAGGDMNVVVRVGDTVRRPPEPPEVVALLQWYEAVGFDGAPRFLGHDDEGREILSFVEGEPAFAPVPSSDDVVAGIGRLLRRAHDAQAGFAPAGLVIGHGDLFWTNVIFRNGLPVALIDWELARPMTRVLEVALAATYWAGVRIDEQLVEWGIPLERRGERLRLLCDAYGFEPGRACVPPRRAHRVSPGTHRSGASRGTTPIEVIRANLRLDRGARGRTRYVPRVKPITVMVTASGAPGTAALLGALRRNGEREVRLVGTDMSERSVGRHLCDAFHLVPGRLRSGVPRRDARRREARGRRRDPAAVVVRPRRARRARRPVPDAGARVEAGCDRALERQGRDVRVPAPDRRAAQPEFRRVNGAREVEAAARELGYPERPVCFKPVFSSGSRGFRVLDPTVDRAHQLLNERPGSVAMRLEEAVELLPDEGGPDLLVMELATGGERTIDGIGNGREIVLGHPKTREAMRAGLAMYFVTLDDDELMRIGEPDRRRARDRALLQHPARRRARDRDQPADLDDRLPGGPEPPVPGREARARRDLGRRAARRTPRASAPAEPRCATSTSSSSTPDGV